MADEDFEHPFDLPDDADGRPAREILAHLGRKLDQLLEGQQDIMTALTDLQDAVAAEDNEVQAVITYLQGVPGLITAAVAAGNTDAPALEALAATIASDTTKLTTAVAAAPQPAPVGATGATGPATPPPAVLTITPNPVNIPAGQVDSTAVTITGATGSLSAAGLPTGVTFTGSVFVADATTVAGTSTVTISDSATPPATGTVSLVLA
jgi:hypothetical protein